MRTKYVLVFWIICWESVVTGTSFPKCENQKQQKWGFLEEFCCNGNLKTKISQNQLQDQIPNATFSTKSSLPESIIMQMPGNYGEKEEFSDFKAFFATF